MRVPEEEYFTFVIPAVIAFIIGLHIFDRNSAAEKLDVLSIVRLKAGNPRLPFILIVYGFIGSVLQTLVPSEIAFVLYLVG
ncbi:MAG: hypothetical protein EOO01_40370, partial [Chitinophagaceae bacterium]